jgi:hypothetical protein
MMDGASSAHQLAVMVPKCLLCGNRDLIFAGMFG